jgi:CheY-like chemotaxis protein
VPGISTGLSEKETEKPQILIVGDYRVSRRAAFTMLSDDYLVHEAVDGRDGWQQLQLLLQEVAEKLNPFLDYVANRLDTRRTGTDTS